MPRHTLEIAKALQPLLAAEETQLCQGKEPHARPKILEKRGTPLINPAYKEYSFRAKTLTVESVDAGHGKRYTVFAEVMIYTNASTPSKFSSTARGPNVSLDIGLQEKQSFPRTMQFMTRDVFRFGITPFITEGSGTLRLDLPATRSANAAHQSLEDVVASIRANLAEDGYVDNHP